MLGRALSLGARRGDNELRGRRKPCGLRSRTVVSTAKKWRGYWLAPHDRNITHTERPSPVSDTPSTELAPQRTDFSPQNNRHKEGHSPFRPARSSARPVPGEGRPEREINCLEGGEGQMFLVVGPSPLGWREIR